MSARATGMRLRPRSPGLPLTPVTDWLGRVLVVVLGVNVALAWMAIQASIVFAHAVWLAVAGQVLAEAEPSRIARQLAGLRLVQTVAWLSAGGLFLAWVWKTRRRLSNLGVPRPSLLRIPRTVSALWQASAGDRTPPRMTTWVRWWWGLCLVTVASDLFALPPGRWLLGSLGLGGGLPAYVLGECLRIGAAVLTIVVVTGVERHQRDPHAAATFHRGGPDA